jgi:Xaa-Pro aminopeptidase
MPVTEYERLKSAFRGVDWVDAGPLLWELRSVKSPAEIHYLREAGLVNWAAQRHAFRKATVGNSERDVYEECVTALVRGGARRPPQCQMTINSSTRKRNPVVSASDGPNDIPFRSGDVIFLDTGCSIEGYWAEFTRMAVVGEATTEQQEWHALTRQVNRAWWENILHPGITCDEAMRLHIEAYERAGVGPRQYRRERLVDFPRSHHCHGLGLESSEPPRVRVEDRTIIQAGMVLSVETYLQGDDGLLYGTEEDVLITVNGCELLTPPDSGLETTE